MRLAGKRGLKNPTLLRMPEFWDENSQNDSAGDKITRRREILKVILLRTQKSWMRDQPAGDMRNPGPGVSKRHYWEQREVLDKEHLRKQSLLGSRISIQSGFGWGKSFIRTLWGVTKFSIQTLWGMRTNSWPWRSA